MDNSESSGGFAFNFSGDDIDVDADTSTEAAAAAATEMAMAMAMAMAIDVDDRDRLLASPPSHNNNEIDMQSPIFDSSHPHQHHYNGTQALSPAAQEVQVLVKEESIAELLESLPSRLSYNTVHIPYYQSSTSSSNDDGGSRGASSAASAPAIARTPRRALFDVRIQLMSEDSSLAPAAAPNGSSGGGGGGIAGLSDSDIERNIYEGGFKTWESAIDMASYLLAHGGHEERSVVELGCGSAIPSLQLFRAALQHKRPLELVLCDYNSSVLRLVTLPNLFLSWAAATAAVIRSDGSDGSGDNNGDGDGEAATAAVPPEWEDEGDLEITPELISRFVADLEQCKIKLRLISGPWGPELVSAITSLRQRADPEPERSGSGGDVGSSGGRRLIMASETIYSPHTLPLFTDTFLSLLCAPPSPSRSLRPQKQAAATANLGLVGAKRIYFGVGGGVDQFLSLLHAKVPSSSSSSSSPLFTHRSNPISSSLPSVSCNSSSSNNSGGGSNVAVKVKQLDPSSFLPDYSSKSTTLTSSTAHFSAEASAATERKSGAGAGAGDETEETRRGSRRGVQRCLLEISIGSSSS